MLHSADLTQITTHDLSPAKSQLFICSSALCLSLWETRPSHLIAAQIHPEPYGWDFTEQLLKSKVASIS